MIICSNFYPAKLKGTTANLYIINIIGHGHCQPSIPCHITFSINFYDHAEQNVEHVRNYYAVDCHSHANYLCDNPDKRNERQII